MEKNLEENNLENTAELEEICKVSAELKNSPLEVSLESKAYIQADFEIVSNSFEYLLDKDVATKL